MKRYLLLALFLAASLWAPSAYGQPTGCSYPTSLDSLSNVVSGQVLASATFNKIQCIVENIERNFRLPNYTVATKPASPALGQKILVTDALDDSTCDTGGGTSENECVFKTGGWVVNAGGGGGGAPTGAKYIVQTGDGTLSAEQPLSALATGLLKNTTGTGVLSTAVEGTDYYKPGGVKVGIVDGGTGSGTASGARTNLSAFTQRTFVGHSNVLSIANADGLSAAPDFKIANSLIDGSSRFAADAGSTDDYAACPLSISTMSAPAYVDMSVHGFRPNTINTGPATINFCGLGVRPIVKVGSSGISMALASGDLRPGGNYLLTYHASNSNFQVLNLGSGGGGTTSPGGSPSHVQYQDANGAFGGDAGFTFDAILKDLAVSGLVKSGNVSTNSFKIVLGGGVSGHRIGTWAINTDANIAGTTGSLPTGNCAKFDAQGRIVDHGAACAGGSGTAPVIRPHSIVPVTSGKVFPNVHVGAGANSKYDEGLGVMASLDADATWALRFQMPQSLPTGTGKLRLIALANATSGSAKVNPKWVSVAMEEDPSAATPIAEGTQTITWGAGDNDQYKELKVNLDADTLVAGEIVVMNLIFETTSWTLAQVSTWQPSIIWE